MKRAKRSRDKQIAKGRLSSPQVVNAYLETSALIHFLSGPRGPQADQYLEVSKLLEKSIAKTAGKFVLFELAAGYLSNVAQFYNHMNLSTSKEDYNRILTRGDLRFKKNLDAVVKLLYAWLDNRYFSEGSNIADWSGFQRAGLTAVKNHFLLVWRKANSMGTEFTLNCHPELESNFGKPSQAGGLDTSIQQCRELGYECGLDRIRKTRPFQLALGGSRAHLNRDEQSRNSKELQNRVSSILEVRDATPPDHMDTNRCRCIGDAFVALDCPKGYVLVTANGKHFDLLCKTIKKEMRDYIA